MGLSVPAVVARGCGALHRYRSCQGDNISRYMDRRSFLTGIGAALAAPLFGQGKQLRIIGFGAHPDDCEIRAGGCAALWAQMGHKVKFVATTNGDAGHPTQGGAPLARRRRKESDNVAKVLGIEYDTFEVHDGELMPTLENRMHVIRKIREWNADLVMAPRPNDYHPDHRYTGVLVQDAAYMVAVPAVLPTVRHLDRNPVFLYYEDRFKKPTPFQPDIVVDISKVWSQKIDRKSTRLNSSHLVISYAVFCLKNKTN